MPSQVISLSTTHRNPGVCCPHHPFPWALTTAEHPCSSRESMTGHFYFLTVCCLTSPTHPRPVTQHSSISGLPFLLTWGTKLKSLPDHSTTSLENSHLEMCSVMWNKDKKKPPQKWALQGLCHCWGRGKFTFRFFSVNCPLTPVFSGWEKSLIELTNGKQIFTKFNYLIGFSS